MENNVKDYEWFYNNKVGDLIDLVQNSELRCELKNSFVEYSENVARYIDYTDRTQVNIDNLVWHMEKNGVMTDEIKGCIEEYLKYYNEF